MRILTKEEVAEIQFLRSTGVSLKVVAPLFELSDATISSIANGKKLAGTVKNRRKSNYGAGNRVEAKPHTLEDFSKYPDTVLFEHVKECNFIG